MQIAITGATGFIGRYIVRRLAAAGHTLRAWHRQQSNRDGFDDIEQSVEWVLGDLGDRDACEKLVVGCEAVIHGALYRPGRGFQGAEGDVLPFVEKNVLGSLQLIEAARSAKVPRFIFISTCAVHDIILNDRPLDETHPTWAATFYGAHKAAIENFVYAYGHGHGYDICALRPTGVYGLARPASESKWFDLVRAVVRGDAVTCDRGGKEVHAADVAKAAELLLTAQGVAGQAYNCYDRYVSQWDVAQLAKEISGSRASIAGHPTAPKHQIVTDKLRGLGMQFGGTERFEQTIKQLVDAARD